MKTNTQISALLLIISMMFASSTFAMNKSFDLVEEDYIDDIPFNTEWVVNELMTLTVDFEEEAYVDDIPFNTVAIAASYNYEVSTALTYELVEEEYVDDIPFSTEWIANEVLSEPVTFNEEAYVDDIPFDTRAIANESLLNTNYVALKK